MHYFQGSWEHRPYPLGPNDSHHQTDDNRSHDDIGFSCSLDIKAA